MATQTTDDKNSQTVPISDYAVPKGVTTDQVERLVKQGQLPTSDADGQKLIEIETPGESRSASSAPVSREQQLEKLLHTAETAARRNERARRKWQLLCAMSLAIFFPAMATVTWLYGNVTTLDNDLNTVRAEKLALTEQLNSANVTLRDLTSRLETLGQQTARTDSENAQPGTQSAETTASISAN
ncbi:MAG: hypothetical protein JXN61_08545, partial [Sedimentisphaerales bacterium]|nr:hypothetical protein [Sedimentisphaerales bacterium]